ncbi:hypothetical protein EHQ12_08265 [Leptospira gomenensis]|uniref:DJ-1/PfpI domain-containing protein n=1 Tax=Leptospira gomenensis TaxID=2484974 RepID=A0A5F1YDT4_9LEPT|nr:DJ-1/PfpI family protein [Leptospira gomenensis]TGK35949.1 hypothetical protein EHQ17_05030 [Leptospira gomenensis]TGK40019.1 hypothetical protein EHQ12_08265 [Leptospira gomenensis]TGK51469.1 hypothetical protein EHQ07_02655 [Leptospira gomenensis]TGK68026.1 hypothetical protein EHQ13_01190 [Leptospira gomenensis]
MNVNSFDTRFIFSKYKKTIIYFVCAISIWNCGTDPEIKQKPALIKPESGLERYKPRFGRKRPVIAVIGETKYTELSDFIVPFGVLKRAKIADIHALADKRGTMNMFPALKFEIGNDFTDFDLKFPEGADYVIVPAVHNSENRILIDWIRDQSRKGATVIGICDGVWLVSNAGLLNDKRATGHWYSFEKLREKFPSTQWIRNKRYVADRNVITTTGVTASIPISLALVESIAGKQRASNVARDFGVTDWSDEHCSSEFAFETKHYFAAAKNLLFFWNREDVGIPVFQGMDEVSLALAADAYARTFRTNVFSISNSSGSIRTKSELLLIPDLQNEPNRFLDRSITMEKAETAVNVLKKTLTHIELLYGNSTSSFVSLQIEYPKE